MDVGARFVSVHALAGAVALGVTAGKPEPRIAARQSSTLQLSDFSPPAGHGTLMAFLGRASRGGTDNTGFYRNPSRGGTDVPLAGSSAFGRGLTVSRLRRPPGTNTLLCNAERAPGSQTLESFALRDDVWVHIQTAGGAASLKSSDFATARRSGGGYTNWENAPVAFRNLIDNIDSGDRFIFAFTSTASFTTRHAVTGDAPLKIAEDASASFTTRHAVSGAARLGLGRGAFGTFVQRHAVFGSAGLVIPLSAGHFQPPDGHSVDMVLAAVASADSFETGGFYRTSERGGSDTPLRGSDARFGPNNDGKITRLRFLDFFDLAADQTGYTGGSGAQADTFRHYVLQRGLRCHIWTQAGAADWQSTDHTSASAASAGSVTWSDLPKNVRLRFENLHTGERFILAFTRAIEPVSGTFTTRHAVTGSATVDVSRDLTLADFQLPAGRRADLLFLAEADVSGTTIYGSDNRIAGDDRFNINRSRVTGIQIFTGPQLNVSKNGGPSFAPYARDDTLQVHVQTLADGVASWQSNDHIRFARSGFVTWHNLRTRAERVLDGIGDGDRFILAFTLPTTDAVGRFTTRHTVTGGAALRVTPQIDQSGSFRTRHAVTGSATLAVIGRNVSASFAARHTVAARAALRVTPQIDLAGSFQTRHTVTGSATLAVAPQVDESGTFRTRHAVTGSAVVAVTGRHVSASFATRHAVTGSATVAVGRGMAVVSGSFTIRHPVTGAAPVFVTGTNEAGAQGIRVEFDGLESEHVQQGAKVENKIGVVNTAELTLTLDAADIADVPARGAVCEIFDAQTNRLLLAGTVDEPAVAFVNGGRLVIADLFIAGHDARLNDRLLSQDEGIAVAEQTTAQAQAESVIGTLAGEGFTHDVTLHGPAVGDDFRFVSPRNALNRIADHAQGAVIARADKTIAVQARTDVEDTGIVLDTTNCLRLGVDIDQQNFRTDQAVAGGEVIQAETLPTDGTTASWRIGGQNIAPLSLFAPTSIVTTTSGRGLRFRRTVEAVRTTASGTTLQPVTVTQSRSLFNMSRSSYPSIIAWENTRNTDPRSHQVGDDRAFLFTRTSRTIGRVDSDWLVGSDDGYIGIFQIHSSSSGQLDLVMSTDYDDTIVGGTGGTPPGPSFTATAEDRLAIAFRNSSYTIKYKVSDLDDLDESEPYYWSPLSELTSTVVDSFKAGTVESVIFDRFASGVSFDNLTYSFQVVTQQPVPFSYHTGEVRFVTSTLTPFYVGGSDIGITDLRVTTANRLRLRTRDAIGAYATLHVAIRHMDSGETYTFDLAGATKTDDRTLELAILPETRAALNNRAASDRTFDVLVVDDSATGVDTATLTYAPDYEELAVTDIVSLTVDGVAQELGGASDTWSFSRPRQAVLTTGTAPGAASVIVATYKANWIARASSGQTPHVQRYVTHSGAATATDGAALAMSYVDRHRYPTTTIIAIIEAAARLHLEVGDGVRFDPDDLARLRVADPDGAELWRADRIDIQADGDLLIYSGRFTRRADESRYRELWSAVLKATGER